ncbi:MAG: hypothetical protein WD135_05545 [Ferruginibacter sp.]
MLLGVILLGCTTANRVERSPFLLSHLQCWALFNRRLLPVRWHNTAQQYPKFDYKRFAGKHAAKIFIPEFNRGVW